MRWTGLVLGLLASAWCLAGAVLCTFGISDSDREFVTMVVVGTQGEEGLDDLHRLELLVRTLYVSAVIGVAASLGVFWRGRLSALGFCAAIAIPLLVGITVPFMPMPDRLLPPALVVGPLLLPALLALFAGSPSKRARTIQAGSPSAVELGEFPYG